MNVAGRVQRLANVLCLREKPENSTFPYNDQSESNMFSEAEWIWSSLTDDQNILANNTNLFLQMASSGEFSK